MLKLKAKKRLNFLLKQLTALVLCCCILLPPPSFGLPKRSSSRSLSPSLTAEILGILPQFERLQRISQDPSANKQELLLLRAFLLRRILLAVLEVRQYCNRLDLERAYAYDIMQKEARRQAQIGQLYTVANFAQLSTFYTLEPFVRFHDQFVTSAIFTTVSGSLNTGISTLSRIHAAVAKANHVAPPKVLGNLVEGGPIDASGMPPLLAKYFETKPSGSEETRKEALFEFWKRHYKIDGNKPEQLCSLVDKKKASLGLLRTRILLLWSMQTFIQEFDCDLLGLLKCVDPTPPPTSNETPILKGTEDGELVKFLRLGPYLQELKTLKQDGSRSERLNEIDLYVLEKTLESALEIQVASDKIDEDLYYNYHIILSDLLTSRAKWLQLNHDINFLQSGILGIVAGRLYLSRLSFQGDRMFVITGSNGTALTTLAMMQMHGFWRKNDSTPNSLAEIFNLHPQEEFRFSPFVSLLLNSPPPGSVNGKTRRELLNDEWKRNHVTSVNLDSNKIRGAVSSMPSHKFDTISLVKNRITLLHSLKKQLESFQSENLEILLEAQKGQSSNFPTASDTDSKQVVAKLSEHAREAARLLGIETEVQQLLALKTDANKENYDEEITSLQLDLLRKIMTAGLQLRVTSAQFDREITREQHELDKVTRERDFAVNIINNANFLQLGILSIIIDGPLEETKNKRRNLAGDRLNIVSGLTVGGLALMSLCAQPGGFRHTKSEANLLGQSFGLETPDSEHLPSMLWRYLESVPPNGVTPLTRRQQLIKYWQTAKILPVNIKKTSTIENVSGCGPRHHRWCETIKLMTARITMLFDLKAMVDRLNTGLVELLQALA